MIIHSKEEIIAHMRKDPAVLRWYNGVRDPHIDSVYSLKYHCSPSTIAKYRKDAFDSRIPLKAKQILWDSKSVRAWQRVMQLVIEWEPCVAEELMKKWEDDAWNWRTRHPGKPTPEYFDGALQ